MCVSAMGKKAGLAGWVYVTYGGFRKCRGRKRAYGVLTFRVIKNWELQVCFAVCIVKLFDLMYDGSSLRFLFRCPFVVQPSASKVLRFFEGALSPWNVQKQTRNLGEPTHLCLVAHWTLYHVQARPEHPAIGSYDCAMRSLSIEYARIT